MRRSALSASRARHVQTRRALHQELERLIDELLSYPDGCEIIAQILAEAEAQQDGNTGA